jgi:hypothetical protein
MRFVPSCRCCCPCCHALPGTLYLTFTAGSFGCLAASETITLAYQGKAGHVSTWRYTNNTCAGGGPPTFAFDTEDYRFYCVCAGGTAGEGGQAPGYYLDVNLSTASPIAGCSLTWGPVSLLDAADCNPFYVDLGTATGGTGCTPASFSAEVSE